VLLCRHIQGADTNIYLRYAATKSVIINVIMLWYQKCRILLVLVKMICINII